VILSFVGMPGCGKSTVGRHLARQLSRPLVDSDAEIEREIGGSIRGFFEQHGEQAFRDLEQRVIDELTQRDGIVLATGGGAVLRPDNRDALHGRTVCFYLRSSPEELARRLRNDTQRPLLQGVNPQQKMRELFRERDPLYRRTAHYVVEAQRPSVQGLLNMVLMQLELAGHVDPAVVPSPVGSA
jgi:shikimate kinase